MTRIGLPVLTFLILVGCGLLVFRHEWAEIHIDGQRDRRDGWRALAAATALAIVAGVCVWQAIERHRRNLAHAAAIEALNDIALTVVDSPAQAQEALQRVAQLAAGILDMPICGLNLFDYEKRIVTVAYRAGFPDDTPFVFSFEEAPASKECIETGKPVYVNDMFRDGIRFGGSPLHKGGVRCMLLIPLKVHDKPFGALAICDTRPRKLSAAARRMATLWASHAAIIVRHAELSRRTEQARQAQQRLTEQRESLYQVNLRIPEAKSLDESLQLVADLSPAALEMEVCIVALPTGEPGEFRLSSVTQLDPPFPLAVGTIGRRAHIDRALQTRQPVIIADAASAPDMAVIHWPVGSALYVPLIADNQVIGVMGLYRRESGTFPPEQVKLAELFAARAAVAVQNFRLLEQTRADAQTKAILLRELNHRVKNNLAGIIGLLSTAPRKLPADCQQWLNRVIDRIDAMSRVHELFVNGVTAVGLPELIRSSVGAVLAIRPPGVVVQFELAGQEIQLRSDRAITLAMVMHELCFNALRHGVGETGTITVQSRFELDGRIRIDVMDDGGLNNGESCSQGDGIVTAVRQITQEKGGIGLSLVRGLVGRELRGEFELQTRPGGGTTATIYLSRADRNTT